MAKRRETSHQTQGGNSRNETLSISTFRVLARGALAVAVAVAGVNSIGWMTAVNFTIGSDFRRLLLAFALVRVVALILYRMEK